MTDNKKDVVFGAFLDLEILVQHYRKAVLWLTHGNHERVSKKLVLAGSNRLPSRA
jgi:hypothetical protein